MKYKVRCTHIISQLLNVQKYAKTRIVKDGNERYIEVDKEWEAICIEEMERAMCSALRWYTSLIDATQK